MFGIQSVYYQRGFTCVLLMLFVFSFTACTNNEHHDDDQVALIGTVFAGPINEASCQILSATGERIAGPVNSKSDGEFSITVTAKSLDSDLRLVCKGGTFTDEATGVSGIVAGELAVYIAAGSLSTSRIALHDGQHDLVLPGIHATPQSTIIHSLVVKYGKTLSEAQGTFQNGFYFEQNHTVAPAVASNPDSNADSAQLLAGLHAAAFSQLNLDLGLTIEQQFDLIAALAQDLSNDTLDGVDGNGPVLITGSNVSLPIDMQNRYAQAILNFRDGGNDNSGLANNEIGSLPFGKVAVTDSYKVEYLPGMMAAMQGKTRFKIRLSDINDDTPVSGQMIMIMPMMHMAEHMHATPVDGCSDDSDGTYSCTLYYLMPTSMMNGETMGYWDLKIMLGGMSGEEAHFYPQVMIAMGDSSHAVLKGVADEIAGMMMPEKRNYYLFKSELLTNMTNGHDFELFIAAKESMMNYPSITSSGTLNSGDLNYELVISTMTVEVSTDTVSWAQAVEGGNGYWSVFGISGLTDGEQTNLYVRMVINSEQKTTNGNMADGANDYATFLVTPNAMSM